MSEQTKTTSEKRLLEISKIGYGKVKKIGALIFLLIGYWQAVLYFTEKPNLNIYIENSYPINKKFVTKISIINGSQAITNDDIIKPISLNFSEEIFRVQSLKSVVNPQFLTYRNSLNLSFDLLNKDEIFSFLIVTQKRPKIEKVEGRIKSVEEIFYSDYELKPKPLKRFLNIWIFLFFISIFLFVDALIVILKDIELQKLFSFARRYNLNRSNIDDYIENYGKYYSEWEVNIKPNAEFMKRIIRNLFLSFPHNTKKELEFIKQMTCYKTSLYSFYRVRTVFVVVGPILFIISLCAVILNYFYYEINGLSEIISMTSINKIATNILLILGIFVILFPSRIMNSVVLRKYKKGSSINKGFASGGQK